MVGSGQDGVAMIFCKYELIPGGFNVVANPSGLSMSTVGKPRGKMALTCPDIFEPVGFRDNGFSHLRSSDEASEVYGRADRSNIARGG